MTEVIDLKNYVIFEFCSLNRKTGETYFYKGKKKVPGFTGVYFKNDNTFFAMYPSKDGLLIFYEKKEYKISKDLSIKLIRQGDNRKFIIEEYGIKIDYKKSSYVGFDSWSDEMDVDLFYMIEHNYLESSFYEQYTCKRKDV